MKIIENSDGVGYSSIQFLGMCICTTPGDLESIEETSDNGVYLGLKDNEDDIKARVNVLKNCIEETRLKADNSSSVLKIFVVPEFFFRGCTGAYFTYSPLLNFFDWQCGELRKYVAQPQFDHWLFIFGTMLTTSKNIDKNIEPTKSLYPVGDDLLDVYHRLHPSELSEGSSEVTTVHSMLRTIDEDICGDSTTANASDLPYQDVLKCSLNYCDLTSAISIDNSGIVVGGGSANLLCRVLKQNKSKEDFVLNSQYKGNDTGYLQSITNYAAISEGKYGEIKQYPDDPYAVFLYGNVWIGIDICLDHSKRRLVNHLMKTKQHLDIQIIPSCGMDIRANAVIARKGGYAFNCDGEYVLNDPKRSNDGEHSHTSLMRVETEMTTTESSTAVLSSAYRYEAAIALTVDPNLFAYTKYEIHVYPKQPLPV